MLKDTTSRGLCRGVRVRPPHTIERRGEGDLTMSGEVASQEVGEEERVARGGVDRRRDNATSVG